MKQFIKRALGTAIFYSGLTCSRSRDTLTILTFHRIVDEGDKEISVNSPLMISRGNFEKMLQALLGRMEVITLDQAVKWLKDESEIPLNSIVVTFDDGYLDTYQLAYPLLKQYGVPITVFLATDYIGATRPYLWWEEIAFFYSQGLEFPGEDLHDSPTLEAALRSIDATPVAKRLSAVNHLIRSVLNQISAEERIRFGNKLTNQISASGIHRPRLMLSWDEVRDMAFSGLVSFEPHTASHCLMDQCTSVELVNEISVSKKEIEQRTNQTCRYFAYPAGRIPSEYEIILEQTGMHAAVTTQYGIVRKGVQPFLLPRKDAGYCFIDGVFHLPYFMLTCTGNFAGKKRG